MKLVVATALAACLCASVARSQEQCSELSAACMASCASVRKPERCMQACQGEERRCAGSGSFRMRAVSGKPLERLGIDAGLERWRYEERPPAIRRNGP